MNEPAWVVEARRYIGAKEIPGKTHNPLIVSWWKKIRRGGIKDDDTPWCAAFVGACLENAGIVSSRYESARSYLNWGIPVFKPVVGCLAVFERNGGGHVGFVVGLDQSDRLMILGGNQGDAVNIKPFDRSRVVSFRWPKVVPVPSEPLRVVRSTEQSSTNEA